MRLIPVDQHHYRHRRRRFISCFWTTLRGCPTAQVPRHYAIHNFDPDTAERFASEAVKRKGLVAGNMAEFLGRMLEFSQGNPGAILAMLEMAKTPKYRSADRIKVTPLYIDFRLNCP